MFLLDSSVERVGRGLLLITITASTATTGLLLLLTFSSRAIVPQSRVSPVASSRKQ